MNALNLLLLFSSAAALRRVNIGFGGPSDIQNEKEESLITIHEEYSPMNAENILKHSDLRILTDMVEMQLGLSTPTTSTTTTTTTTVTPITTTAIEKSLRKVNVKPRGGRLLKNTNQNLVPYHIQLEEEIKRQQEQEVAAPANETYGDLRGNTYTKTDLNEMCVQAKKVGTMFGIKDMTSFAGNNCALIQLYYANVSCDEIGKFVEYCEKSEDQKQ